MRPIRLAVIFDQQIRAGGGYQHALNAALLTRELPTDICEPIFFTLLHENVATLAAHGIQAELIQLSFFQKARTYLRRWVSDPWLLKLVQRFEQYSPFERRFVHRKIDLVYFLSPTSWARDLDEINYIITVWDLCHRDHPEFPEVRWTRQFEVRDNNYWSLLPRATAIFVDSKLGKRNVVQRFGIDDERVHVMPFQAAAATREPPSIDARLSIDVHAKYNLDVPYVFYPAQFWAHKNHVYILEGLRILQERYGIRVGAIFSGGEQGNLSYVKSYVRSLNLEGLVRFVGFVDNEEIPDLYRQSIALVMPSYFGPTNLPPLEAMELCVPVLYSDKAGLRDQVGEAALLMDLNDPGSMADHLKNLIDDPQLRIRMIEAGKECLKYFADTDRVGILTRVCEDFRWRRLTWA
jgi:glycosyltransferase involved in cell wall biosynthesis